MLRSRPARRYRRRATRGSWGTHSPLWLVQAGYRSQRGRRTLGTLRRCPTPAARILGTRSMPSGFALLNRWTRTGGYTSCPAAREPGVRYRTRKATHPRKSPKATLSESRARSAGAARGGHEGRDDGDRIPCDPPRRKLPLAAQTGLGPLSAKSLNLVNSPRASHPRAAYCHAPW